jgi:hypothetical protein
MNSQLVKRNEVLSDIDIPQKFATTKWLHKYKFIVLWTYSISRYNINFHNHRPHNQKHQPYFHNYRLHHHNHQLHFPNH